MQLRHINIRALIAEAGGDPWAIEHSLHAVGRPRLPSWRRRFTRRVDAPPRPTRPSRKPVAASKRPGIEKTASTRSTTPPKCSA